MEFNWAATDRDKDGVAALLVTDAELIFLSNPEGEQADPALLQAIDALENGELPAQAALFGCPRIARDAVTAFEFHPDEQIWRIRFQSKATEDKKDARRDIPPGLASKMPELLDTLGFDTTPAAPPKNKRLKKFSVIRTALDESSIILFMVILFGVCLYFLSAGDRSVDPDSVRRTKKRAILEISRLFEPWQVIVLFSAIVACIFGWEVRKAMGEAKRRRGKSVEKMQRFCRRERHAE